MAENTQVWDSECIIVLEALKAIHSYECEDFVYVILLGFENFAICPNIRTG